MFFVRRSGAADDTVRAMTDSDHNRFTTPRVSLLGVVGRQVRRHRRSVDGARLAPARAQRAPVQDAATTPGASGLTRRVRLLFCLLTVISVALRVVLLPTTSSPIWPDQVLAAVALACLMGWSVCVFLHGRVLPPGEIVVPVALLTWGPMAGDIASVFAMAVVALFQRSLYGSGRRVLANAVALYATFLVVQARTLGAGALLSPTTLTNALGVLFCAWLMYTLGRVLRSHEETARGKALLARAGGRLMAAQSTDEVYDAALDALLDLPGDARAAIGLWRIRGEFYEKVAVRGDPSFARHVMRVPMNDIPPDVLENLEQGREFRVDRIAVAGLQARLSTPPDPSLANDIEMEALVCPLRASGKTVGSVVVAGESLPASMCQTAVQVVVQAGLVLERVALHEVVRGVVDGSADTFVTVDADGRIEFVSAAVRDMLGCDPDGLLGTPFAELLHPDGSSSLRDVMADHPGRDQHPDHVACRLRHRNGSWRDAEISARSVTGGDGRPAVLLNVRDVTDRKALEAEIAFRAYHDGLTGLANRTRFAERLEQALERARRTRAIFAVAYLDIDDFKTINDSLGHTAGDQLLVVVGRRLRERLRPHDVAARFGGDEFAVLIEDAGDARDADRVVQRLVDGVGEPLTLDGSTVRPRTSVGLVVITDPDTTSPSEIMRDADTAMYAAKHGGKGRLERFRESMRAAAQQKLRLRTALAGALERGEFSLEYQPVLELASERVTGAEALLRWHHPEFGLVSPEQFVLLAEEDATIVPIDHWVVSEACRQLRRWYDLSGRATFVVAVNVSARNFQDGNLVDVFADALRTHRVPAERLVVEVTESAFIVDSEGAGRTLAALRDLGVRVAIDDFGNGYSSLSYLQRFPVDYLKIDRSFITAIGHEAGGRALAHAIVRLAGALGVAVIAEGVEDHGQASSLRRWGCEYGQGFLFGWPVPPVELDTLVCDPAQRIRVPVPPETAGIVG
jgi:diguanylate cyclase (GGDEF)-like protein/PAS domain S-box-containing protein